MSRNWVFYLEDILESALKVQRYTEGMTFEQFQSQDVVFDAVVRNLEIIGEAATHLPPDGKAMMPLVDWNKVAGFRDVIVTWLLWVGYSRHLGCRTVVGSCPCFIC